MIQIHMVDKTFLATELDVTASACPLATISCYQLGHSISCTWIHASIGQLYTGSRALKRKIVTTLQVQLCIGVKVQLQVGIKYVFLLLVIACFNNSRFSGVVTLNSHSGVLSRQFSLFVNKLSVSNLIFTAFSYLMIYLCYHVYCM